MLKGGLSFGRGDGAEKFTGKVACNFFVFVLVCRRYGRVCVRVHVFVCMIPSHAKVHINRILIMIEKGYNFAGLCMGAVVKCMQYLIYINLCKVF